MAEMLSPRGAPRARLRELSTAQDPILAPGAYDVRVGTVVLTLP